jgi:ComF family protein
MIPVYFVYYDPVAHHEVAGGLIFNSLMFLQLCSKYIVSKIPHTCAICRLPSNTNRDLCSVCYNALPWLMDVCYQCGEPLTDFHESVRCQQCTFLPPICDRFCALFGYKPPVNKLITDFKFKRKLAYGNLLGQLLLEQYPSWYKSSALPEVLIPVPLHDWRHRARGFNQVQEILRPLAATKCINIVDDLCIRTKYTKPQTKRGAKQRRRNLRGAFCLTRKAHYEHIAIVDDVFTTGSTIRAISEVFRAAGVSQIDVWCVCRA